MTTKPNTTWHVRIGHEHSLCGLNPQRGHYNIAEGDSFFTASSENQCERCIEAIRRKGYDIQRLRLQYRAVFDRAREADGYAVVR